jgi:hypothetical protein
VDLKHWQEVADEGVAGDVHLANARQFLAGAGSICIRSSVKRSIISSTDSASKSRWIRRVPRAFAAMHMRLAWQGYFSTWPQMFVEFSDLVGQTPDPMRLPPPSAAAISRMEAALGWMPWLEPVDAKIAWLLASGTRWKEVCWTVGLSRAAAHEHWLYGLCLIAWRAEWPKWPEPPGTPCSDCPRPGGAGAAYTVLVSRSEG